MEDPLYNSNIEILKEAFPSIDNAVIDDILWSVRGDVNEAFESLLAIASENDNNNGIGTNSQTRSQLRSQLRPSLPSRGTNHINNRLSNNATSSRISTTNPFLADSNKPLTFREEVARWRHDLREESRRKAAARNTSTPNLPTFSGRSFLYEQNHDHTNRLSTNNANGTVQRIRNNTVSTRYSVSSPNINYRQYSNYNYNHSLPRLPSNSDPPPALPRRRQTFSGTNDTNPFFTEPSPSPQVQGTTIPATNPNFRETSENDMPSFNPFEEPDLPPPAYSEISEDTVVNLDP
ncbi:MAG: hypothetical protein EXX96DRAFT_553928 [Benjaminiella poitrasii]|nr:MAG: hypothetical protein EXX96DRAFT_553928 [Benjaminiella poitrasii]